MIIFPAIDILNNRAVRLLYGKRDLVTDYGSPIERAALWAGQGAEYLHVVNLDGAFDNSIVNDKVIINLVKSIDIPIQVGGGIKTYDRVKYYLEEVGVSRVILGSALVTDRQMAERAFAKYGDRIACGIDMNNGKVCIKGWVEEVELTPIDLALDMKSLGADTVIYTDISRDGALCGVNADATEKLQLASGLKVIASGGMSRIEDVDSLVNRHIYGAIVGRSIYTGDIDLNMAIRRSKHVN